MKICFSALAPKILALFLTFESFLTGFLIANISYFSFLAINVHKSFWPSYVKIAGKLEQPHCIKSLLILKAIFQDPVLSIFFRAVHNIWYFLQKFDLFLANSSIVDFNGLLACTLSTFPNFVSIYPILSNTLACAGCQYHSIYTPSSSRIDLFLMSSQYTKLLLLKSSFYHEALVLVYTKADYMLPLCGFLRVFGSCYGFLVEMSFLWCFSLFMSLCIADC
jgi:hypothetical protein